MIQKFQSTNITFRELEKGIFLTQHNLGTPHPFRMKSGQNAAIGHTNDILPRYFQGAFWHYDMDLQNPTAIPLKPYKLWEVK